MDIRQGLENLQWHSKSARHLLTDIIDKLDELDGMDLITPSTKEETDELINRKDNATVDLYNCLQGFLNLLEWYREELDKLYSIEKALKLKLIQNDKDSDEVIKRCVKIYGSMFNETYYPETWNKEDFTVKTHSLTTDLKNRISNRLMREDEIPEFKERMVDYGANKDLISNEPMTRQRADRIASNLVFWIDHYLSNVCRCQKNIADILDEGYSLMYPQPDTSTVKKQLIKSDILSRDNIIRAIFKASVERGFMQYGDGVFEWLKSSHLIPFFCEKVCNIFANEEDNENKYAMFNGMIVFNGKALSNIDISQYRKNWYKTPSRKGKIFAPKGYLEIEDFIAEMKDGYVNYID